jgi:hypothetical protein
MVPATCVATPAERRRPLAVDTMVPDPIFTSTHAITINASADRIWPWLAQMGAGRGGWYSWDAIDNGSAPSASHIAPELQRISAGDVMPAVPGARDAFVVAAADPPFNLVLTVPDGRGGYAVAWQHLLEALGGSRTRLIVRSRASSRWIDLARRTPRAGQHQYLIERAYGWVAVLPRPLLVMVARAGHRVMEARHLRGIRRRSRLATAHADADWVQTVLLVCGILSSLLYLFMNVFVPLRWPGYSLASRTVSELSAIDAPTQPLWVALGLLYPPLVAGFGLGVWQSARGRAALRATGALLVADSVVALTWPPMHQRAVLAAGGGTLTDTLHLVWAFVTVLLMFLAMAFAAGAFGRRFRIYSVATIVVLLACGLATVPDAARVAADLPTPWIGIWERINIGVFLAWVVALAVALLREKSPNHLPPAASN